MDSEDQQHGRNLPGLSRRRFVAMGVAAGAGALAAGAGLTQAAAASTGTSAGAGASTPAGYLMTPSSLGVNTTSGDSTFLDTAVAGLLRDAHIGRVRYPGGGGADFFDWQTDGPVTWRQYMAAMDAINAAPLITVNYGELSQGPEAAAAWVKSADTFAGYSGKTALWVLGNEEYGAWELDQHPDPHTPESFAVNVLPYFEAMHAADPETRVGFPMTVPRQVSGGTGTWVADPDLWNRTIMKHDAGQVDFIDFHWYPVFGVPVLSNAQIFETVMGGQSIPVFMPIGFAAGGQVSIGTGAAAETATIAAVGESSSLGTTTVAPAAAGDRKIYVTQVTDTNTGIATYVGDPITIDSGGSEEVRVISGVGTGAAAATTLAGPAPAGVASVRVANSTGITAGHPLLLDSGAKLEIAGPIAGVSPQAATTLAAAAATGDTSIKVDSVAGLNAGDTLQIGVSFFGSFSGETAVIQSVGTAGASGTGVALTAPLTQAAASGTAVTDVTSIVTLAAPVTASHAAGVTAQDIGTGLTLSAPLEKAHATGVPARDAGTGLTLAAPLRKAHADGTAVTTPGTGLTLDAPLARSHDAGEAAASTGITLTPALTRAHPNGTTVNELGLAEPPLDTPMPAYWGYVMASLLTTPGAYLSDLPSPAPNVLAFQSFLPGTSHAVLLINTDDTAPVAVAVHGLQAVGTLTTHSYGLEQPSVVQGTTPAARAESGVLLRPESMTVLTGTVGHVQPPITLRVS